MNLFSFTSLFPVTDEQAMRLVQAEEDARAFGQLMQRWEGPIRRLCARMVGNEHKGEDLAQETFARVYSKRKEYETRGKFSTWLWRIAINICHDELRRMKRRPEMPLPEFAGCDEADLATSQWIHPDPGPDEWAQHQEQRGMVRDALLQLPEPFRAVVVMRHYENLKFREIAEILDIPEGTVKSRMAEALSQLNAILSKKLKPENNFWTHRKANTRL